MLLAAVEDIFSLTYSAFSENNFETAQKVEPLEQVIDDLKERIRKNHIKRLQRGECNAEAGFVLSDLLTNLERVSDHCSNVAGAIIDLKHNDMMFHESIRNIKADGEHFLQRYEEYSYKYTLPEDILQEE